MAHNGEQIVHSPIGSAIGVPDESGFPDGSVDVYERKVNQLRSDPRGLRPDNLWIIGRRAASSYRWMNMATRAGIQIEAGPESVGEVFHLYKLRRSVVDKEVTLSRSQGGKRLARTGSAAADSGI